MSGGELLLLLGVFAGGAAPWLEAIVVVPAGIVAGLPPVPAVLAGVTGNLLTVAAAAWGGERIRRWWSDRRQRRRALRDPEAAADGPPSRRRQRAERIIRRYGMPALALLGPLGLGTQLSAVVAVGAGVSARASFAWIGAATVLWGAAAGAAAVAGVSLVGA